MISFKSFLTEAINYEDMFKTVLALEPSLNIYVKDQIEWAKKTLKKQDRIVWYLGWVRFGVYALNREGKAKDVYDKEVKKILNANKLDDMTSVYDEKDAMKAGFRFSIGSQREVQNELEHFYSLKIDLIENYVYKPYEFWNSIHRKFIAAESEWASGSDDEIPYREQPFEEDDTFNEDNVITPIMKFDDDYYWVSLDTPYCRKEGNAMGHCGNTASYDSNDTVLSFRKLIKRGKKQHWLWYPSMTFILNDDGYLGEMKGRQNKKPAAKYHPYIIALLTHRAPISTTGEEGWYIRGVRGGGYAPEQNFALKDLSAEDREELYTKRPEMMPLDEMFSRNGKNEVLLEKIKSFMPASFKWIDDGEVAELETHKGGIESFMEDYGNDTAKWCAEIISNGFMEIYDVDTSDDFIDRQKLESFLEEHYPDDKEDWEDDEITWAKENLDGLEEALRSASYTAAETGAYNEVVEYVIRRVDDIEIIGYDDYDTGETCYLKRQSMWEDPLPVYISFRNALGLASKIERGDVQSDEIRYLVKIDEPYYGFSGWDEEAGMERFKEELPEELDALV